MEAIAQVKFADVPIGAAFYDYAYSGEWMLKLGDESGRFNDGLIGLVAADCPVKVWRKDPA